MPAASKACQQQARPGNAGPLTYRIRYPLRTPVRGWPMAHPGRRRPAQEGTRNSTGLQETASFNIFFFMCSTDSRLIGANSRGAVAASCRGGYTPPRGFGGGERPVNCWLQFPGRLCSVAGLFVCGRVGVGGGGWVGGWVGGWEWMGGSVVRWVYMYMYVCMY